MRAGEVRDPGESEREAKDQIRHTVATSQWMSGNIEAIMRDYQDNKLQTGYIGKSKWVLDELG